MYTDMHMTFKNLQNCVSGAGKEPKCFSREQPNSLKFRPQKWCGEIVRISFLTQVDKKGQGPIREYQYLECSSPALLHGWLFSSIQVLMQPFLTTLANEAFTLLSGSFIFFLALVVRSYPFIYQFACLFISLSLECEKMRAGLLTVL